MFKLEPAIQLAGEDISPLLRFHLNLVAASVAAPAFTDAFKELDPQSLTAQIALGSMIGFRAGG